MASRPNSQEAQQKYCEISGRLLFDGKARSYCCRTCKTTSGKLHGQECDRRAAIEVKQIVMQIPLMKPYSPRSDTGPRRKQAPLRHDPHAAAMTEWKWYDGSRWMPTRKEDEAYRTEIFQATW
jgi:hypothetical protein